jgi:hypothetical protein
LVNNGPVSQASAIAAMYSLLLFLAIVLKLNIWNADRGFNSQFISAFLTLLAWAGLNIYFQGRPKTAYYRFINESKRQRILGAMGVNIVVIIIVWFFVVAVAGHQ